MTQYGERADADGFELRPGRTPVGRLAADVWRSRRLIAVLARKDFFVRYRRTLFGSVWAVGLPLVQAVVLALVVGRFVEFDAVSNYPVFVFSGMVVWTAFSTTVAAASTSIVDASDLSTKIYFPRAVFPLAAVGTGAYALVLSIAVLLALTAVTGELGVEVLLVVPAALVVVALVAAFSLLLSAAHVYFRDVRYLLQAALLAWFYVTPVFYPLEAVGEFRPWIESNPLTGAVELLRAATVGAAPGWGASLVWTLAWTVALVVVAAEVHARRDRLFADLL